MNSYQNLLNTPVLDFSLYQEDFTWDMFFHTPVLTAKFVSNKLGIDLISFCGSEAQANKMLTQLAKTAKDYLFSRLPMRSRDYQEFRISRDKDLLYNYLEYQCAWIIAAQTTGSVYELYNIMKKKDGELNTIPGLENAAAMVATKFRTAWEVIPTSLLRKGY